MISGGVLQLGDGATNGSIVGAVTNTATLAFDPATGTTMTLAGVISGAGAVDQVGAGATVLSGVNSYTGATRVMAGALYVDGNQSVATGATTVASGAVIGGAGVIGGSVAVAGGAMLAPGDPGAAPGTLTINGDLTLSSGAILSYRLGQANAPGGPLNDLTQVGGNLTLAGTLNVTTTSGGAFGPGVYRVLSYVGSLTNNGLTIGASPSPNVFLQMSVANQVNLINTSGLTLNVWDGALGPKNDGVVNGGAGAWQNSSGNDNWTTATGSLNAPFSPGAFAVFQATPGTVTVDNSLGAVSASGMQFASNGYVITGGVLALVGPQSTLRVGDGTAAGAGYTATIAAALTGASQLVKTDLGTLVLAGANTYSGGTAINGGALQVGADSNLGAASGPISFDGGALNTTASFSSARTTTLNAGGGTFDVNPATTLTLSGVISGAGSLTKTGKGALALAGANAYAGGTAINGGALQVGADSNLGAASGPLSFDGGTLNTTASFISARTTTLNAGGGAFDVNPAATLTLSGVISGAGSLTKAGAGALILSGADTYSGGTMVAGGTLQLGDGAANGSIVGNVTNNATLAFDPATGTTMALTGVVSGVGAVNQIGAGVTVLTGANTYSGGTTISGGTLQLGAGGATGSILGSVANNGALTFDRSNTMTFAGVISGAGAVNQIGAGVTVLTGASSYSGPTNVAAGTLQAGAANTFSANSAMTVAGAGALDLNGFSQTVARLSNAGLVSLGRGATPGAVLTVAGDYVGNGGTVVLNTALGGSASPTDELVVRGGTTGSSALRIVNVGGLGAQTTGDGIRVVEVDGASNGAFSLAGQYRTTTGEPAIVAGAYAYTLQHNGVTGPADGDWYLRSQLTTPTPAPAPKPLFNPGAPLYENYPQILLGLNGLPTLQQRVSDRSWTQGAGHGLWGRFEAGHSQFAPPVSTTGSDRNQNVFSFSFGADLPAREAADGSTLLAGINTRYAHASADITSVQGKGGINTDAFGLGATLTWYGAHGLYVDGQAQGSWYVSGLNGTTAGQTLARGNDGAGYAVSIESGWRQGVGNGLKLTPQAQLVYSGVTFDAFHDPFGARVSDDRGDSLLGRLGLALDRDVQKTAADGSMTRTQASVIANLTYEFLGGARVQIAGADGGNPVGFSNRNDRLWAGLGIGGAHSWKNDTYTIFADASLDTSLANLGKSYTLHGRVGVRFRWL